MTDDEFQIHCNIIYCRLAQVETILKDFFNLAERIERYDEDCEKMYTISNLDIDRAFNESIIEKYDVSKHKYARYF